MNIKVVELIKVYNFILVISSYDNVVLTLFIKFTYLSFSFINYEGYVKFMNNVTTTMSDEQMIKIKVVDLGKL
jgi:hypothetical protein